MYCTYGEKNKNRILIRQYILAISFPVRRESDISDINIDSTGSHA